MPDLLSIWGAGRVLRWHTNRHLASSGDWVDGHAARVAKLALALHPEISSEALVWALIHDDGEHRICDMNGLAKRTHPEIAECLRLVEREVIDGLWGKDSSTPPADPFERQLIALCDALDAYLWVRDQRPDLLTDDGWPEQIESIRLTALHLGLLDELADLLPKVF